MVHVKSSTTTEKFEQLLEELLSCTEEQVSLWFNANRTQLSLAFLQFLKDTQITSASVLRDPIRTDQITSYALRIAKLLSNEPQAKALAQWMRGIWAMHNHVSQAHILFRSALDYYRSTNDRLSVAKLSTNLVGVLADTHENEMAEKYYKEARTVFLDYVNETPQYLIALEQNFGYLLYYWGRYEEALAVHDQTLALAIQYNLTTHVAEIRVNRHLALRRLGRLSELEAGFLEDRKLAANAEQPITVARIDMDLGELYTVLGRPMDALRCFQQATKSLVPMEQGPVLATQATLLRHLGAFRAALKQYDAALALLSEYGLKTFYAQTLVNIAICLRQDGDKAMYRRSCNLLNQAEQAWQQQGNTSGLAQIYLERILLAQTQNKLQEALALIKDAPSFQDNQRFQAEFRLLRAQTYLLLQQTRENESVQDNEQSIEDFAAALQYADSEGAHWLRREVLSGQGQLFLTTDWSKARLLLEEAVTTDDQMRQLLSVQELKASFHEQANDLYDHLIQGAYQHQEFQLMLQYAWRAKASAFIDLARTQRNNPNANDKQDAEIARLRQQIAALRLSFAKDKLQNLSDAQREASSPELNQLLEQLLELHRHKSSQTEQPHYRNLDSLQHILAKLEADLLIEYVRCGNEIYGICANRYGVCVAKRLADSDSIQEVAGWLGQCFESYQNLKFNERLHHAERRIAESLKYLAQCYSQLIAPLTDETICDLSIQKVLIAPCDVMATLPFAAFWTGSHYWIEDVEIELIQSGALLQLDLPSRAISSQAIAVAATSNNVVAVVTETEKVAAEIDGCKVFIDTPFLDHLRQLEHPPSILHIAAHTIQRGDAPLFTGIELKGEVLSVEQCFDLPLWGSELVTLSGCSTAGGMESDASLFAFQSALLLAGAKRVICTLWQIGDSVPTPMMVHFYRLLRQGFTVPSALCQTQRHFLRQVEYTHPAFWAMFTTIRR